MSNDRKYDSNILRMIRGKLVSGLWNSQKCAHRIICWADTPFPAYMGGLLLRESASTLRLCRAESSHAILGVISIIAASSSGEDNVRIHTIYLYTVKSRRSSALDSLRVLTMVIKIIVHVDPTQHAAPPKGRVLLTGTMWKGSLTVLLYCSLLRLSQGDQREISLNGDDWTISNSQGNVTNLQATVPGQVHLDLLWVGPLVYTLMILYVWNAAFLCLSLLHRRHKLIEEPYCKLVKMEVSWCGLNTVTGECV